ncbi:MAG: FAD-dependent oxidoreductase [Dehalococcoidales bacterium]
MNNNGNISRSVLICQGTSCSSQKSKKIREAFECGILEAGITDTKVDFTGCQGFCALGPVVIIEPEGILYTRVTVEYVPEIIRSHLQEGRPVSALFYTDPESGEAVPYYKNIGKYKKQHRLIMRNCGHINPEKIADYEAVGGYKSLKKIISHMSPQQVVDEIRCSGLRGRGGGGFPIAQKWDLCRATTADSKYVICNADEGDPGAFMDRNILEGDPHSLLEGLIIAGYAAGASKGFIYLRSDYKLAVKRIKLAIEAAKKQGYLGENIFGSGFSFDVSIRTGVGAYVCGEETALIATIEGKRGTPHPRPPYPAERGLWGQPTVINNVKTLANIPLVISQGADSYAKIGTVNNSGTAVLALSGKIVNGGIIEVPMGTTLREIIFDIGGGIPNGRRFKAVQIGGPSEACLPAGLLNTPVDFDSLAKVGASLGSGGIVVMDEDTCIVDIARYFLSFTQLESCGKCTPCRLGTKRMLDILERICNGKGKMSDLDLLLKLAKTVKEGSLCGLGQSAPNTVLTTLRYFKKEYEEHILRHHCRAAVCRGMVKAPCIHTCPAEIDVPRYIRSIQKGQPGEALAIVREKIPFPAVCGLVCFHPCESRCRRAQLDEAVSIRELKRYAVEYGNDIWKSRTKKALPSGKRVAVIGSGPAGLTAAYYLARSGHSVTVYESQPLAGGMLRMAIPDYRLPKDILDADIDEIISAGVTIKTNTEIYNVESLFEQGFNAVFVAIGAQNDLKIGISGEDDHRFIDRLAFLKEVNSGKKFSPGDRVGVIGGGHAAVDVARTSRRLGAGEVTIIYRRSREDMPAGLEEIEKALAEGINILEMTMPVQAVNGEDGVTLECIRMQKGDIDSSGRYRSVPMEGSEFSIELDSVIASVGQRLHIPDRFGLDTADDGFIGVDNFTLATDKPGVYAGGDAVLGPSSVIEAISQGRQAAKSIDIYLGGSGIIDETLAIPEDIDFLEDPSELPRQVSPVLPASERIKSFSQVELGYDREIAEEEARRCLRCDLE